MHFSCCAPEVYAVFDEFDRVGETIIRNEISRESLDMFFKKYNITYVILKNREYNISSQYFSGMVAYSDGRHDVIRL